MDYELDDYGVEYGLDYYGLALSSDGEDEENFDELNGEFVQTPSDLLTVATWKLNQFFKKQDKWMQREIIPRKLLLSRLINKVSDHIEELEKKKMERKRRSSDSSDSNSSDDSGIVQDLDANVNPLVVLHSDHIENLENSELERNRHAIGSSIDNSSSDSRVFYDLDKKVNVSVQSEPSHVENLENGKLESNQQSTDNSNSNVSNSSPISHYLDKYNEPSAELHFNCYVEQSLKKRLERKRRFGDMTNSYAPGDPRIVYDFGENSKPLVQIHVEDLQKKRMQRKRRFNDISYRYSSASITQPLGEKDKPHAKRYRKSTGKDLLVMVSKIN